MAERALIDVYRDLYSSVCGSWRLGVDGTVRASRV